MSMLFFIIAIVFVIWGVVSALVMTDYISKRGHKINVFLFRLYIYRYIHTYCELTKTENGKPGFWFYSYIVCMNVALICVIIGAVLK
ncbi:hypothetical protein JXO52_16120 [bacterium]|nr:hypothetical protein [bacterium]